MTSIIYHIYMDYLRREEERIRKEREKRRARIKDPDDAAGRPEPSQKISPVPDSSSFEYL